MRWVLFLSFLCVCPKEKITLLCKILNLWINLCSSVIFFLLSRNLWSHWTSYFLLAYHQIKDWIYFLDENHNRWLEYTVESNLSWAVFGWRVDCKWPPTVLAYSFYYSIQYFYSTKNMHVEPFWNWYYEIIFCFVNMHLQVYDYYDDDGNI